MRAGLLSITTARVKWNSDMPRTMLFADIIAMLESGYVAIETDLGVQWKEDVVVAVGVQTATRLGQSPLKSVRIPPSMPSLDDNAFHCNLTGLLLDLPQIQYGQEQF